MHVPRLTRLIDRLALVGHPATEALLHRGLRSGTRSLGRTVGTLAHLLTPTMPLHRLGEAFDEGLEDSGGVEPTCGHVLRFPGHD